VAAYQGVVYVADQEKHTVWRIGSGGSKTAVAGTGGAGFNGDGIAAIQAELNNPTGIVFDASGNLYIADSGNHAIRKVATPGALGAVITTVAGIPASFAVGSAMMLYGPRAVAIGPGGQIYIADRMNQQIRRADPLTGALTVVAGVAGETGANDGPVSGPVSCLPTQTGCVPAARFNSPVGVAVDANGNVYVADEGNDKIRVVTPAGSVRTLSAGARAPTGVALTPDGNTLYIADYGNHRIRRMSTPASDCSVLSPVAGTGTPDFSGDGSAAPAATLNSPIGVAFDGGVLYIADHLNGRIRKVEFPSITP